MKTIVSCLLSCSLALGTMTAYAGDKVWLIGGGNTINNSQGQIEENVLWLQSLFEKHQIPLRTYYTDGNGDKDDVIYFAAPSERNPVRETLLRVFGSDLDYAKKTKRNALQNIAGTTQKDSLIQSLQQDFKGITSGDDVLVVYNGHGAIKDDTRQNSLKLWGDTRLNISELDQLLDSIPQESTVRFVLTQCFSGSFSSLVFKNPYSQQLGQQKRCGFLSESDIDEAEGCDLGTNPDEFRDYTTYFFAALDGQTRQQAPLKANPDFNQDGRVDMQEAHYYSILYSDNSDLSRSTSENLLESMERWFTRWDSVYRNYNNPLASIHDKLTSRYKVSLTDFFAEKRQIADLHTELSEQERQVKSLSTAIKSKLGYETNTSPDSILALSEQEQQTLSEKISAMAEFEALKQTQDRIEKLHSEILTHSRLRTHHEAAFRYGKLARIYHSILNMGLGSSENKAQFEQVDQCEKAPLF